MESSLVKQNEARRSALEERWQTDVTARLHFERSLRITPLKGAVLQWSLEPNTGSVLVVRQVRRKHETSIRFVSEIAMHLDTALPAGQRVRAEDVCRTCLLRQGAHQVQFQSTRCSGSLVLEPHGESVPPHGLLDLTFEMPSIDLAGSGRASVLISF